MPTRRNKERQSVPFIRQSEAKSVMLKIYTRNITIMVHINALVFFDALVVSQLLTCLKGIGILVN